MLSLTPMYALKEWCDFSSVGIEGMFHDIIPQSGRHSFRLSIWCEDSERPCDENYSPSGVKGE